MFPRHPWGRAGRVLRTILLGEIVVLWIVGAWCYVDLPPIVPLHFNARGEPTDWGDKVFLLVIPAAMSIGPAIIFLVAQCRFWLLKHVPYLVNLPAVFLHTSELPPERRSEWVNRYFELLLGMGVALGAYLLVLELVMCQSMSSGTLTPWSITLIVAMPLVIVGVFLMQLRTLTRRMVAELQRDNTVRE
ncbi:MAG: DUF1648 domain-containing protein [Chlorobi bacterium]|nr:DUF1648 domain-containing protein [Chlorobiota bacterium]